jgi:hypothetical protein
VIVRPRALTLAGVVAKDQVPPASYALKIAGEQLFFPNADTASGG